MVRPCPAPFDGAGIGRQLAFGVKRTPLVAVLVLALAAITFFSISKAENPFAASPKETSNLDWLASVPDTPGAWRFVPLSESLELMDYSGFRFFARLPKIDVKPDQTLYYLFGTNTYEGTPGQQHLVHAGIGMADIVNAGGGVPLSDLPEGFEYTVFFRRDGKDRVAGFKRFGFVDPVHHGRVSGGSPFSMSVPENAGFGGGGGGDNVKVALDKEVEVAHWNFITMTPDGKEDTAHTVTVKWYYAFQVAPTRH